MPHFAVVLGPVIERPGLWWVVTGTSKVHRKQGTPVVFEPGTREFTSARVLDRRTYFYACHLERVAAEEIRELPRAGRCVPEKFMELRTLVRDEIEKLGRDRVPADAQVADPVDGANAN